MARRVFADFRSVRVYFIASIFLFGLGAWLGASTNWGERFAAGQLRGLSEFAEQIDRWTWFQTFLFIFFNNAFKALLIIFLGALLGILPAVFVVINGMVLGYLYQEAGSEALMLMLKGVLPHGWLELPVVLLAAAYGMRFGAVLLQSLFVRQRRFAGVESFLESTLPLMKFVVASLAVAALIESVITPWILGI